METSMLARSRGSASPCAADRRASRSVQSRLGHILRLLADGNDVYDSSHAGNLSRQVLSVLNCKIADGSAGEIRDTVVSAYIDLSWSAAVTMLSGRGHWSNHTSTPAARSASQIV